VVTTSGHDGGRAARPPPNPPGSTDQTALPLSRRLTKARPRGGGRARARRLLPAPRGLRRQGRRGPRPRPLEYRQGCAGRAGGRGGFDKLSHRSPAREPRPTAGGSGQGRPDRPPRAIHAGARIGRQTSLAGPRRRLRPHHPALAGLESPRKPGEVVVRARLTPDPAVTPGEVDPRSRYRRSRARRRLRGLRAGKGLRQAQPSLGAAVSVPPSPRCGRSMRRTGQAAGIPAPRAAPGGDRVQRGGITHRVEPAAEWPPVGGPHGRARRVQAADSGLSAPGAAGSTTQAATTRTRT
jgi:hypothetical protein